MKAIHLSCLAGLAAALTIPVSDVDPIPLGAKSSVTSAAELFTQSCPEELAGQTPTPQVQVLLSSYSEFGHGDDIHGFNGSVYPSSGSLVRGAIEAWAQHQSLVLRPDTLWFEVLTQLNYYMANHSEEIRHLFVDFDGKQEIVVQRTTWKAVLAAFAHEIQKRVKTSWLEGWIAPGFSTSTPNDNMTATVLMMGLTQHYFQFTGSIICGLPSVILLGTKNDWTRLRDKLARLAEFGQEPAQFAQNLQPIMKCIVQTWDEPDHPAIKSFWGQIVRANKVFSCERGLMEFRVSGWIAAFMHWRPDGGLRVQPDAEAGPDALTLDGVNYFSEGLDHIPVSYAKAPLKMLDYPHPGTDTMSYVLGGNVGISRTTRGKEVLAQPLSSWSLYAPVDTDITSTGQYGSWDEVKTIADGLDVCNLGGDE